MIKRGAWGLLLAACLAVGASPAADGGQAADPVWGDYAALAGRTARAGTQGYQLRWYWAEPGKELVQEYRNPGDGSVAHREVITPGPTPGTLVLQSSAMGNKQWNGTLQPDGRVLFIGKGLFKLPYLAGKGDDGTWQVSRVDLDDGRLASVKEPTEWNRFAFEDPDAAAGPTTADAAPSAGHADEAAFTPAAEGKIEPAATAAAASATATAGTVASAATTAAPLTGVTPEVAPASKSMFAALRDAVGLGETEPAGPPPVVVPDFGQMEAFIGRRFVYRNLEATVSTLEDGRTLAVQYGQHAFHLRATAEPGKYEVLVHPPGYYGPKAELLPDGRIDVILKYWSPDELRGMKYRFRLGRNDYGGFDITTENNIRFALDGWDYVWGHSYRPYSAEVAAMEREQAVWDARDRAEQARQRAIQQAEEDAAWNRALGNMASNLADYSAREQQRMDESQRMLDEINAMARAEAEAQRRAEEQAAFERAEQQRAAQQAVQLAAEQRAEQYRLAQQQAAEQRAAERRAAEQAAQERMARQQAAAEAARQPTTDTRASTTAADRPATDTGSGKPPYKTCQQPPFKTTVFDQTPAIEGRIAKACGRASPTVTRRECDDNIGWCKVWIDCSAWEAQCGLSGSAQ